MTEKKTWEITYKERDLPTGGTERRVERVTAICANVPSDPETHFTWFDYDPILSVHQDVVESVRLVDSAS